jgi:hypothetical protein
MVGAFAIRQLGNLLSLIFISAVAAATRVPLTLLRWLRFRFLWPSERCQWTVELEQPYFLANCMNVISTARSARSSAWSSLLLPFLEVSFGGTFRNCGKQHAATSERLVPLGAIPNQLVLNSVIYWQG